MVNKIIENIAEAYKLPTNYIENHDVQTMSVWDSFQKHYIIPIVTRFIQLHALEDHFSICDISADCEM